MGKKIFVSYKYSDMFVQNFEGDFYTTPRNYVDEIEKLLEEDDHIYKGEDDDEDIGSLAEATIATKLGDKIFDSSITILIVSKHMKDNIPESEQWIPWEVCYSLKEQSRGGGRSKTNGVLAVVLPDESGSYEYFIKDNTCPYCDCRTLMIDFLFQILKDNMFNIKNPVFEKCDNHVGNRPYQDFASFIYSVKWFDFIKDINKYLGIAEQLRQNINQYYIVKTIS